jgi:predicted  nucleic acid-binding Zn-ribbon protein
MATRETDEANVASRTLAYLRSLDRKLDLVVEVAQRHGERLGRLERDLGDVRRDIAEVKGDMALLDNKMTAAQTEILAILHRLDQSGNGTRPRQ